jgi:hypothetical protein
MTRKVRKVISFGMVALVAILVVAWPSIMRGLVERGLEQARSNGINLSWNGLATGHSSLGFESLTLWIPGPKVKGNFAIPISVDLQRLSLALRPSSLISLAPAGTFSTQLYAGTLSGDASTDVQTALVNANVEGVQLGKHPQLASIGVQGGVTSGSFQGMRITPRGVEGGTFSFRIRELAIPTAGAVRTLLQTENLGTVDIDAEGTVTPSMVNVTSIRLSSLFGSVVGSLSVTEHLSRMPSLKGSFQVSLSENGITTLGPWLPLIPNAGLDPATSAFEISLLSAPCSSGRASGTFVRLPSGCLDLRFERR